MKAPGTRARLTCYRWDGPPFFGPEIEGDFIRTTAGSCYRIDEARRSRPGSRRVGVLVCTRLERDAVSPGEPGVHLWEWAKRG